MEPKRKHDIPPVGKVFEHRYKGEYFQLIVVDTPDGVMYQLGDELFRSPTAAANFIVGDKSVNGRKFWHIDD